MAVSPYLEYTRRLVVFYLPPDLHLGPNEHGGHLFASEVLLCQHKRQRSARIHSIPLKRIEKNPLIRSQNGPLSLSGEGNPSCIVLLSTIGIIWEMVLMDFNFPSCGTQGVWQFLAAQVSVYEKDRIRLRGLL